MRAYDRTIAGWRDADSILLCLSGNGRFPTLVQRPVTTTASVNGVLALDASGNLYVGHDTVIDKIAADGSRTPVAGMPGGFGIRLGALPGSLKGVGSITYLGANAFAVTSGDSVLKIALP